MKKLLRRAKAGDDDAFAELFQANADALWKCALSIMRDEGKAADMVQETAIKAWRALPTFNSLSKVSTWLTRILVNTCYDELRSKKNEVPLVDVDSVDIAQNNSESLAGDVRDDVIDVRHALSKLSADDRAVLTLFYINDLPIREISQILELSEGAIRTRLTRARSRLKEVYMSDCSDCPDRLDRSERDPHTRNNFMQDASDPAHFAQDAAEPADQQQKRPGLFRHTASQSNQQLKLSEVAL